jgi:ketosteroid isomerase-like protein
MEPMERAAVQRWVEGYERAWRTAGTDDLARLFAPDATYLVSPWARPVEGLAAIRELWESQRDGADEAFTMASDIVAVEADMAVVRVAVAYGAPDGRRWRDLWVLRFDNDGRCAAFEEWPFAPGQDDGHGQPAGTDTERAGSPRAGGSD